MSLTVGSLFSGIGGFDLGLERAGMKVIWQVENDKRCQEVLRHHWPNVEVYGDVRTATGLAPVDLICGGFPCQDLSVAGKRAGLDGDRSGLWFEFLRVVSELRPEWVLIENVPGLLSSNGGRDMGVILQGLEQLGYRWAYRVLDSQHFGVAQRRGRVFIVGSLGAGSPAEVLFDAASLQRDPPTRRETRERIAEGTLSRALSRVGGGDDPGANKGAPIIAHTITHRHGSSEDGTGMGTPIVAFAENQRGELVTGDVQHQLSSGGGKPGQGYPAVLDKRPRRLTPRECERLQGFPDDWTLVDGMADGPRYRMLGNAVTVNVAEWIGRRILEVAR